MAVEKPTSRVSRSEGGTRPSGVAKHAKNLRDIRVTSQKQALQHTVRAKKLDERQLFKFLKSLDDSKSRRLLQIDKEVAEVEKLLKRLNSEQEDARRQREHQSSSGEDLSDCDANGVTRSADVVARRRNRKKQNTNKMSKEFDEYAFRTRQKRGSVSRGKDKASKSLNAYYRFDSEGNRKIFSPLISSPSKTPKPPARVAWDAGIFFDEISLSNYTVGTETDSRIDSATNKSLMSFDDEVFDEHARAETITPGRTIFMTSGKLSSQSVSKTPQSHASQVAAQKNPKAVKIITPQGVDNELSCSPTPHRGEKSKKGDKRYNKKQYARQSSTASEVSADTESKSNFPVINVTDDDEIPLSFKRSKLKLKRRPTPLEAENADDAVNVTTKAEHFEDELHRAHTKEECTGKSCEVADCIFHRPLPLRRQSSTIANSAATIDEYYRVASATRSRMTGQPSISPVFQTRDDRTWGQTRRLPVSPPSPTPSEILADIVTDREEVVVDRPDFTDLEVMLSVRRPTKGSNRDRMLKDKEDNIKNTFKIMRQKMAASVPPDFNTNYGTPTPNWKILNPLKMRHKIAHKSPLFTLWKLN